MNLKGSLSITRYTPSRLERRMRAPFYRCMSFLDTANNFAQYFSINFFTIYFHFFTSPHTRLADEPIPSAWRTKTVHLKRLQALL